MPKKTTATKLTISPNLPLDQWVMDPRNFADNLKLVMLNKQKVPVRNFMCPICNPPALIKRMKEASALDPDCLRPETQKVIHEATGWHNVNISVMGNIVYHKDCLSKSLGGDKFAEGVANGLIWSE